MIPPSSRRHAEYWLIGSILVLGAIVSSIGLKNTPAYIGGDEHTSRPRAMPSRRPAAI
jgi:hypothetical protein